MESNPPAPVVPLKELPPSVPPSDPPRLVTVAVHRLVWMEPRVRRWWLLGILIVLIFLGYAGDRLWARAVETRLIRSGITMQAKIIGAENKQLNHPVGPEDLVTLELTFPDNSQVTVGGYLSGVGIVGGEVTVHVDPADHTHWTDRSQPTPLLDSLLIGMLVLPLVPVAVGVGYFQSRTLLRTWENGSSAIAVIFDKKQSPIAPMSYALRCSLPNSRDKRLFTVYVPRVGYGLEKGELIWVMTLPTKGAAPLAALWMAGVPV